MNEKMNILTDVKVPSGNEFKPLPELMAFDICRAYPVPGGNLLLRNSRTGHREMITPEVFATLINCKTFRTLDEHVDHVIKLNPNMQGQQADIRQVLKSMLDNGVMVSARVFCDKFKRKPDSPASSKGDQPVVVITTWERPDALARLLKSMKKNCATEKFHHLYVVDDSRDADNIARNRELVAEAAFGLKTPVQYMGQSEQQKLIASLASKLPEHEASIRFLADQSRWVKHWTSGLARNLALLLSCGHRLVMLDDDTICDVFEPGKPRSDMSISNTPRDADFFASEHEWLGQRQALNPDPICRHMQCLGLTLAEAIDKFGQGNLKPAGLGKASTRMLNELSESSKVLVTECGSLGCPGTVNNTWLPDMSPESMQHMLASEHKTQLALSTRKVWTGRLQPHIGARPNMSQITGFDNREMLPPYLPVMRGEDRLFGLMLNFIFPADVSLDYPWAIPHLPMPAREWNKKDRDFTLGPSFPYFYTEEMLSYASRCQAEGPHARLLDLTTWFKDLSATSAKKLFENHRDLALKNISEQLEHLNELSEKAEKVSEEWKEYLQQGIAQLGASLGAVSSNEHPVKGQPDFLEGDELIQFWKQTWGGFAESLEAWPAIRVAAKELLENQQTTR